MIPEVMSGLLPSFVILFSNTIFCAGSLIYILSGEVELTLNDKSYLLTEDTFALILPNEFHAYHILSDNLKLSCPAGVIP